MVNPATGKMTPYEEVWIDGDEAPGLFVSRSSAWQGRVGNWQLALGRDDDVFWAWQAKRAESGGWNLVYSTDAGKSVERLVNFLPEGEASKDWKADSLVSWKGEIWKVIEHDM